MKISSGIFSGITLFSPKGMSVRPTLTKTRQAIFNMLRPVLPGSTVLDFFAGTGAIGFEAISNGAEKAIFVDSKYKRIIHKNAAKLKLEDGTYEVIQSDYRKAFVLLRKTGITADFIFADPPYNKGYAKNFLKILGKSDILNDKGTVIIEVHKDEIEDVDNIPGLSISKQKQYGDTYIVFLNKMEVE